MKLTTKTRNLNSSGAGPAGRPVSRRLAWVALPLIFLLASSASAAVLQDMGFETGPGGLVELTLTLDGAPPEPQAFTTEDPARIVLDLEQTSSALENRTLNIGSGAVERATAVAAGDRTRVVVDLFRSVPFDTQVSGNTIVVRLGGSGQQAAASTSTSSGSVGGGAESTVTKVDFRRGQEGQGRVIVSLDGPQASVDMNQEGDRIVLDFRGTELPQELAQRLDVMDFATPVNMIDTFQRGSEVRMVVSAQPPFEQLAYQTANEYVLEIAPVSAEEEEEAKGPLDEKEYTGERVTLNFQDIEVRAVLQFLADFTGLNIVVSDSVQGNVTLRLQNVPWDQALDIILQAKGLDKRQVGNVIWVAPAQEIAAREQAQLQAAQEKEQLAPLQTAYIQVNYAKASELRTIIQQAGGEGQALVSDRGRVTVDERTNTLLVQDTQENIVKIRDLVNRLDRPVQQVLIESRVVVASSDFAKQLGVRFGVSGSYEDSDGNVISTGGSLSGTDRMSNQALQNRLNGNPSGLPTGVPGEGTSGIAVPTLDERLNVNLPVSNPAGRLGFTILGADYLLDLELSALETEGRGEVISMPRVITANQQEANIKQGVEIPYQEATSSGATNVQFKEAVLELRVTPLITPDERVNMDLTVTQNTVGEVFSGVGGAEIPSIDTRSIETQVLVDNGETVVLGGIFEQTKRETINRVPFLGELPGIGALFRNTSRDLSKGELLIFVTPQILKDSVRGSQ